MLISSVNPWVIIVPIIAAQYILALVAFVFLSKRAPNTKDFVLWNIFILLVFFVGSITFFIYNRVRPLNKPSGSEPQADAEEKDNAAPKETEEIE